MSSQSVLFKNNKVAWKFIPYSQIDESSGTLGVIEYGKEIQFDVKRLFSSEILKKMLVEDSTHTKNLNNTFFVLKGT